MSNAIKVFIKVRPIIAREKSENARSLWQITDGGTIKSTDKQYEMPFDNIYDENKTTRELFDALAKPIVTSALKGINGTIFAYGQTSSGKTYTMMGDEPNPGIIQLTVREIFQQIENIEGREFLIRIGYIEIYNEKIFDLLDEKKQECQKIHEAVAGEVMVNQREIVAISEEQILENYNRGNRMRRTGETNMNELSSRSHSIFRITIESREVGKTSEESAVQVSSLNLVDLAGSERANQTKADGDRLKEGGHINKSLLALGNVIRVLSDEDTTPGTYINYRDSKLTRILSASLGGNAMTSIICTVTPAALDETYSTLLFAQNAEKIKNQPKVNEVMTDQAIMKRMQREIQNLKHQLDSEKSRNSELQACKIKEAISYREGQFLHSHNVTATKVNEMNRRRTWCPSTMSAPSSLPIALKSSRNDYPLPTFYVEPTTRHTESTAGLDHDRDGEFFSPDGKVFAPGEEINLDRTLSPGGRSTDVLAKLILTPREMKKLKVLEDSPNPMKLTTVEALHARVKYLEDELQELNDFKRVENAIGEDHKKLAVKLNFANETIAASELKIEELKRTLLEMESNVELQNAKADCDKALKDKAIAESILTSIQYEHELFRVITKKREGELIQSLDEARDESKAEAAAEKISSLEEQLKKSEELNFKLQSQVSEAANKPDLLAGGDMNLANRIAELEMSLKLADEEREKANLALKEKRNEVSKIMVEYDEISTQLIDSIQENEKLTKQVEKLGEVTPKVDADLVDLNLKEIETLSSKCRLIDGILYSIRNEDEVPAIDDFDQDESIQTLMQLRFEITEWKQSENCISDLQIENEKLCNENELLKSKLPTIQESFVESENELKDLCDLLTRELDEVKINFEEEKAKREESEEKFSLTKKELEDRIEELKISLEDKKIKVEELEDVLSTQAAEMSSKIADVDQNQQGATDLQLESVISENKLLQEKLSTVQESLVKSENELKNIGDAFTNELAQVKINLEEESAKRVESEEKQAQLIAELQASQELQSNIQSEIEQLRDSQSLNQQQMASDHNAHNELEDRIEQFKTLLEDKTVKIKELEDALSSRATEIADLKQSETGLETGIDVLQLDVEKLRSENELLQGKLSTVQESSIEAENELKNLCEALTHELDQVKMNFEEESAKRAESEAKLSQLKTELQSALELQESITAELEQFKESQSQNPLATDQTHNELKDGIEQLKMSLKEKTIKVKELEDALSSQAAEMSSEIAELKDGLHGVMSLGEENDRLKLIEVEHKRMASEITVKMEEMSKRSEELVAARGLIEVHMQRIYELELNEANSKKMLDQMELDLTQKDHLAIDNELLEEKNEALETRLNDATASTETLKTELNALRVEKLSRDEEYEALSKKVKILMIQESEAVEKCKACEQSLSRIDAENTNMLSKLLINEEELKAMQKQLLDRTSECDEVKTLYRRRSCDNNKKLQNLELEKTELVQKIGAIEAQKAIVEQELKKLNAEHLLVLENLPVLQAENERLKHESHDNDMKYAIIDERFCQLSELNQKLSSEVAELRKVQKPQFNSMMKSNELLERQVESLKEKISMQCNENSITNNKLSEERDALSLQVEELQRNTRKQTSPDSREKRISSELYVSQNQQILLEGHRTTPARAVEKNVERKNRRQSVHDERRRLSVWEQFVEVEVQTDPVSEICACNELTTKVKELQIEVRRKDCKILNMERMAQHNPLKLDVDELKKSLTREQRDHNQTRSSLDAMSRNVHKLEVKIEALNKNQVIKKEQVNSTSQTEETVVDKIDYEQLEKKLNDTKRMLRQRQDKINDLEGAIGKENFSSNITKTPEIRAIETENQMLKKKLQDIDEKQSQQQTDDVKALVNADFEKLKEDFEKLQKKYDMTRRLCNLRNDDIAGLKAEVIHLKNQIMQLASHLEAKEVEYKQLRERYDTVKQVCQMRLDKLNLLRAQLGQTQTEND